MKKLFLAFALVACFAVSALGQSSPPLRVKEADGFPNVPGVTTIVVSNGSITSVEGKTIYLTTGGGGGGGSPGGSSTQVQYNAAGSFGGISGFTSDGTNVTAGSANLRATRPRFITSIDDTNGNEVFVITATGSAVNEFTIANAATGNNPTITASGGDANVGINFIPKGSGTIQVSGVPIVTTTATQTLTNKTLTAPVISTISNTGTLTLPTSTDTLVARATTDTLTNKTYDTAGTGNVFRINGTQITDIAGDTGVVATVTGATSNGNCAEWDANGNLQDSGAACGGGGGGGSGANPTASVGLSAVNGVATTFLRSDAAPPLDQAITPTWTGAHLWNAVTGTFRRNSIGTTSTDSLVLENNTAAALGAQQYSPRMRWHASGYKTNATAGPQNVDWIAEIQPVQQTGYPTPYLTYSFSINNAAYVKAVEFRVDAASTTNFGVNVTGEGNFGTPALAINTSKGFYGNGNDLAVKTGNSIAAAFLHNSGNSSFALKSTGEYFWTNSSGDATATRDTSWARLAAGSIRATNGSTGAGNLMLGPSTAAFGTSAAGVLAFSNSTAPSTSPTDVVQVYSGDAAATDHNLYARNEAGQINRLTGLAVRNSAQFDVTSSTTLATITGLTENVEAGRTYAFRAYVQTSAGAGGIKLAVGGTATATAISYEGELTSASDDNVVLIDRATALGTTVCDSSTTTTGTCKIEGVIQVNAAGTLVIQFAQSASNGTASSVLANQYLQLIPIS